MNPLLPMRKSVDFPDSTEVFLVPLSDELTLGGAGPGSQEPMSSLRR
jgi:hypothetical protein